MVTDGHSSGARLQPAGSAAHKRRFAAIPESALALGAEDLKLYVALAVHANREGACRPTHETLRGLTGFSVSTVKRRLNRLREGGFVSWQRGAYTRSPNVYLLPRHPFNEVKSEVNGLTQLTHERGHPGDLPTDHVTNHPEQTGSPSPSSARKESKPAAGSPAGKILHAGKWLDVNEWLAARAW